MFCILSEQRKVTAFSNNKSSAIQFVTGTTLMVLSFLPVRKNDRFAEPPQVFLQFLELGRFMGS
jgi:hypothetical protein